MLRNIVTILEQFKSLVQIKLFCVYTMIFIPMEYCIQRALEYLYNILLTLSTIITNIIIIIATYF